MCNSYCTEVTAQFSGSFPAQINSVTFSCDTVDEGSFLSVCFLMVLQGMHMPVCVPKPKGLHWFDSFIYRRHKQ